MVLPVEELQLEALVELHPPGDPGLLEVLPLLAHHVEVRLHVVRVDVVRRDQVLAAQLERAERRVPRVDLQPMFLGWLGGNSIHFQYHKGSHLL